MRVLEQEEVLDTGILAESSLRNALRKADRRGVNEGCY